MDFQCWGISHKSTSLEIIKKFAFNKDQINEMLSILKSKSGFRGGIFSQLVIEQNFIQFLKDQK